MIPTSAKDRKRERALKLLYPKVAPVADVEVTKTCGRAVEPRDICGRGEGLQSHRWQSDQGNRRPADGAPAQESGKDVAILKIDATNLPTVDSGGFGPRRAGPADPHPGLSRGGAVPRAAGQAERGGGERHVRTRLQFKARRARGAGDSDGRGGVMGEQRRACHQRTGRGGGHPHLHLRDRR